MKNISLRTKMMLGGALIVVVPLLIIGAAAFTFVSSSLESLTKAKTTQLAENIAYMVEVAFKGEIKTIAALSADPQIVAAASTGNFSAIETKLKKTYDAVGADYEGIFIADRGGIIRVDGVDRKRIGIDISDRDYFKSCKEGKPRIGSPVFSRATGKLICAVSAPIRDKNGIFAGAICAMLKIDFMVNHISSVKMGNTGYSFMIDRNGIVIAHPVNNKILSENITKTSGLKALAARMTRQEKGAEKYTYLGIHKLAGFAPVEMSGWSIGVTQDRDEFMEPANVIFRNTILFVLIALAVTVVIGFFTARWVIRPVLDLNAAAKALARGEWLEVAEGTRNDELGEVARSFNSMARQLRELFVSLETSEQKYRSLVDNINVGVFRTTGGQGRFIQINPALAQMHGFDTVHDVMEMPVINFYQNPEDRDRLLEELKQNGFVKNREVAMRKKDGTPIWCSITATPQLDEQGEIKWFEGVTEDITERKQAREAIAKLNEELETRVMERTSQLESTNLELRQITRQLESAYSELKSAQSRVLQQEKMASIGQLAAGVAHEINNPIGFIISNLNSLQKYSDRILDFVAILSDAIEKMLPDYTSQYRDLIEQVMKQKKSAKLDYITKDLNNLITESLEGADRVKMIVQNLKSFARLDETELQMADINMGIESTINLIWNELKYKVTLHKEYGDIPRTMCNLGQLNQVFMNILINASQAIETQGEITLRTERDNGNIRITVSDTGAGIPPDKLDRIFEPFFTTKDVGKGTGLGLSIVYDIIKKHNGDIQVASEVGRGTIFTVLIPIVER